MYSKSTIIIKRWLPYKLSGKTHLSLCPKAGAFLCLSHFKVVLNQSAGSCNRILQGGIFKFEGALELPGSVLIITL